MAIGNFTWRTLVSTDMEASKRFYSAVFGWTFQLTPASTYYVRTASGTRIATLRSDPGLRMWIPLVNVNNVQERVTRAKELGATVVVPPTPLQTARSIVAVLRDTEGAGFSIGQGDEAAFRAFVGASPGVGGLAWQTLVSRYHPSRAAFYGGLFGWTVDSTSTFFSHEGRRVAAIKEVAAAETPHWLCHILVASLEESLDAVRRNGGKVIESAAGSATHLGGALIRDSLDTRIGLIEAPKQSGATGGRPSQP